MNKRDQFDANYLDGVRVEFAVANWMRSMGWAVGHMAFRKSAFDLVVRQDDYHFLVDVKRAHNAYDDHPTVMVQPAAVDKLRKAVMVHRQRMGSDHVRGMFLVVWNDRVGWFDCFNDYAIQSWVYASNPDHKDSGTPRALFGRQYVHMLGSYADVRDCKVIVA